MCFGAIIGEGHVYLSYKVNVLIFGDNYNWMSLRTWESRLTYLARLFFFFFLILWHQGSNPWARR